jgi:HK97 family phage portal protein
LGLSIAAEQFGGSYFANGTQVGGILTAPGSLPELARKNLTEAVEARHRGSDRAHRLMLLENGVSYTATATNPRDSQFNELRTFQLREIARFFRIPVSLLGDLERSTFSNSEQEVLSYFTHCIRPWLVSLEQEYTMKLIPALEKNLQTIEHVTSGFLRADVEKRGAFYAQMVDRGIYTLNEVRALENLPPVAGGDVPRVPMNFEPLK